MKKYKGPALPKPGKFPALPFLIGQQGAKFDPFKGGESRGSEKASVKGNLSKKG